MQAMDSDPTAHRRTDHLADLKQVFERLRVHQLKKDEPSKMRIRSIVWEITALRSQRGIYIKKGKPYLI